MEEVTVGLGERRYPILIDSDCLDRLGPAVREALPQRDRLLVVTNPEIARLYEKKVMQSLDDAGLTAELLAIPEGETHKTVETTQRIWDHLIRHGYSRQSALLALGGGVVGDITGFAAATYMRGVDFVQVPTSLLAMVDSSVGGKTGVNHPWAKNIIGAFWQPRLVFIDAAFLRTLPQVEFRAGFAEVIKHGIIRDEAYYTYLEENLRTIFALEPRSLVHTVRVSCEIKSAVVEQDEREGGLRAILNFGHTLGHAVEALSDYGGFRHGEAVAIGMAAASRIAVRMNLAPSDIVGRIDDLIARAGLPTRFPEFPVAEVLERLKSDKKVRDGKVRFVLPTRIGEVTIRNDVPEEAIVDTVREMGGGK